MTTRTRSPRIPRAVVPVKSIGVWRIISDSYESFEDGTGAGISLTAKISDGEHETDYAVSMYLGCDDTGSAIISNETEDQLHQRLIDIIAKEISNPLTARLIDKRF